MKRTTLLAALAATAVGLLMFVGGIAVEARLDGRGSPGWTESDAGDAPAGETGVGADAGRGRDGMGTTMQPSVPREGTGTFRIASGAAPRVGIGRVVRYRVEVENGIGQEPREFADWVDRILADPRGWTGGRRWAFERPRGGPVDAVIKLAAPDTVDRVCGLYGMDPGGETSCRGGKNVVINLKRWLLAIPAYDGDVDTYRHLVVNHEVGHLLGQDHVDCPAEGQPAPVMQTQMFGMNGCVPNGWPYPDGG